MWYQLFNTAVNVYAFIVFSWQSRLKCKFFWDKRWCKNVCVLKKHTCRSKFVGGLQKMLTSYSYWIQRLWRIVCDHVPHVKGEMFIRKEKHLTDGFTLILDNISSHVCWVGPEIELLAEGCVQIVTGCSSNPDFLIFSVLLLKNLHPLEASSSGVFKTVMFGHSFKEVVGVLC